MEKVGIKGEQLTASSEYGVFGNHKAENSYLNNVEGNAWVMGISKEKIIVIPFGTH